MHRQSMVEMGQDVGDMRIRWLYVGSQPKPVQLVYFELNSTLPLFGTFCVSTKHRLSPQKYCNEYI